MKKKIILMLFLFSVNFLFIFQINAKECKYETSESYYKQNKFNGDFSICESEGTDSKGRKCNKANSQFKTNFTLPSTTGKEIWITVKYKGWNHLSTNTDKKIWIERGSVKINNWAEDVDGVLPKKEQAYVNTNSCPAFVIADCWTYSGTGYCDGFVASSRTEAREILDFIIQKYHDEKFLYIAPNIPDDEPEEQQETDIKYNSCLDFKNNKDLCTTNDEYSCMWVEKKIGGKPYSYCNFDDLTYVRCGNAWDIPSRVPGLVSFLVNLLKIVTPIILILISVISLVKAVAASKEDEIKKAQSTLIRRLIAAAIVFFIVQITQFVILKVADSSEKNNISTCLSCMLNNDCSKNIYYKTKVGTSYECTPLTGSFNGECH